LYSSLQAQRGAARARDLKSRVGHENSNSFRKNLGISLIDSHCHLDASEFASDSDTVRARARELGVKVCLIPSVGASNFEDVSNLALRFKDVYALGIHPLWTPRATQEDLKILRQRIRQTLELKLDQRLAGVGEIGLDGFVNSVDWQMQQYFFQEQLKIAQEFDLPVILHVRRAVDFVLSALRRIKVRGGIAHAFNGSLQQADHFMKLGFKLGMGGALSYPRAQHLRRLASQLPRESLVLETDAPDIPPVWLYVDAKARQDGALQSRNDPSQLPRIAQVLAELRGMTFDDLVGTSTQNFLNVFKATPTLLSIQSSLAQ